MADMFYYAGIGNGNFESSPVNVVYQFTLDCHKLVFTDFDLDGDVDILTTNGNGVVICFYNDGLGSFDETNLFLYEYNYSSSLDVGDLDLDGDLDVIVNNGEWFENTGGNFISHSIFESNDACIESDDFWFVKFVDMDDDDDLDVFVVAEGLFCPNSFFWLENTLPLGCMDPLACNYDDNAELDSGDCCYGVCGCIDSEANNYNNLADCDNKSCVYTFEGTVFFDQNEDGVFDDDEYGLGNRVVADNDGGTYLTNELGHFYFNIEADSSLTFFTETEPMFPYLTTPNNPFEFTHGVGENQSNYLPIFGVSPEPGDVNLNASITQVLGFCDFYFEYCLWFYNDGNVPIDIEIALTFDSLLIQETIIDNSAIDSIVGNTIFTHYDNLLPQHSGMFCFEIFVPTDLMGEIFNFSANLVAYHEEFEVANDSVVLEDIVLCSFDPNDK